MSTIQSLMFDIPFLWPIALIVSQIAGISLIVYLLGGLCFRNAVWKCRICHAGIIATLLVAPLQMIHSYFPLWGWHFQVLTSRSVQSQSSSTAILQLEADAAAPIQAQRLTEDVDFLDHLSIDHADTHANVALGASSDTRPLKDEVIFQTDKAATILQLIAIVYLSVTGLILCRLAAGVLRLFRMVRRANRLGKASELLASECARGLGLSDSIRTVVSKEASMPLALGLIRPTVVVPWEFEYWDEPKKRAVLLHEYSHIARRDVHFELLARIMFALYWIHPMTIWLCRHLRRVREVATDESVLETGMCPQLYARSLIEVIEMQLGTQSNNWQNTAAVAMSAYGDLRVRISAILTKRENKMSKLYGWTLWGAVFVFLFSSAIRLRAIETDTTALHAQSTAQEEPTGTIKQPTVTVVGETTTKSTLQEGENRHNPSPSNLEAQNLEANGPTTPNNDLLRAILEAKIESPPKSPHLCKIQITGKVTDDKNHPLANATVLLSYQEPLKSLRTIQKDPHPMCYIVARTVTDLEGRYALTIDQLEIGSTNELPAMGWSGHLIAAHEREGISIQGMSFDSENSPMTQSVGTKDLRLNKTATIEGNCIDPDGTPISKGNVFVSGLVGSRKNEDFQALGGALQLSMDTNAAGEFKFYNIPRDRIAIVRLGRTETTQYGFAMATASDLPVPFRLAREVGLALQHSNKFHDLQRTPISIRPQPRKIAIVRVVDQEGKPIEGALVGSSQTTPTNENGLAKVDLMPIDVFDDGYQLIARKIDGDIGYWPNSKKIPNSFDPNQIIDIPLEKATRVRGRVVTSDGQPAGNLAVCSDNYESHLVPTRTGEDGRFETVAQRGKSKFVVALDKTLGYELPSVPQLRVHPKSLSNSWKKYDLDVTSEETIDLGNIVVERTKPITIQAMLPNGKPAGGASVVLKDLLFDGRAQNTSITREDLSKAVSTDENGVALVTPAFAASKYASAEIRFEKDGVACYANVLLERVANGRLTVQLQPASLVRGRILLSGKPSQGAIIKAMMQKPTSAEITHEWENHFQIRSDAEGQFEMVLPLNRQYSVYVTQVSEVQNAFGQFMRSIRTSQPVVEVPAFVGESGTETIEGAVVNQAGTPIAGARVSLRPTDDRRSLEYSFETYTDSAGNFVLAELPSGTFSLSPTKFEEGGAMAMGSNKEVQSGRKDVRLVIRQKLE